MIRTFKPLLLCLAVAAPAHAATSLLTKLRNAYTEVTLARRLLGKGASPAKADAPLAQAESDLEAVQGTLPQGVASKLEKRLPLGQKQAASPSESPIQSAIDKVTAARSQLHEGKTSSAKSTLDAVPSYESLKSELIGQLGVGGSGR